MIAMAALSIITVWIALAAEIRSPDDDPEVRKYLSLAERQCAAGAYGSAIRCYRRVLEIEDIPKYRLMLAEAYRLNGDGKLHTETLEDLIRDHPGTLEAYEKLARHYYDSSDYSECVEVVRKAGETGLHSEELDRLFYAGAYRYSILDEKFDDAGIFKNDLAIVRIGDRYFYVNDRMDIIGGTGYESADIFFESTAAVSRDGETCFIDKNGRKYLVPEEKYARMYSYSEGKAAVRLSGDGGYSYINIFGERLPGEFLYASSYRDGIAAVKSEDGWKIIDGSGKELSGEVYEDVKLGEDNTVGHGGIYFVKKDGRYRMIDKGGREIGTLEYEDAKPFMEDGLTAVMLHGLWGFTDRNGNMKIAPQYEDARPFSEGLAAVKAGGLWGFIDTRNVVVIDCIFEEAKCFSANRMAPVRMDGSWTYIRLGR